MQNISEKNAVHTRYNNKDYLKYNTTWHAEDSPWKAEIITKILQKNNISPSSIAEVGCGAGEILLNISSEYPNIDIHGFELSNDAYDICKPKERGNVRFHLQSITDTENQYDVLLCIDVFEHVENYLGFLRDIKSKGHYKVFHIPLDVSLNTLFRNGMIKTRKTMGHLHYFTAETAVATLLDAGYEVENYVFTAPLSKENVEMKATGAKILRIPRKILFNISPNFLSKTLGGVSLLVLAK